jgi:hypothetical protein
MIKMHYQSAAATSQTTPGMQVHLSSILLIGRSPTSFSSVTCYLATGDAWKYLITAAEAKIPIKKSRVLLSHYAVE